MAKNHARGAQKPAQTPLGVGSPAQVLSAQLQWHLPRVWRRQVPEDATSTLSLNRWLLPVWDGVGDSNTPEAQPPPYVHKCTAALYEYSVRVDVSVECLGRGKCTSVKSDGQYFSQILCLAVHNILSNKKKG